MRIREHQIIMITANLGNGQEPLPLESAKTFKEAITLLGQGLLQYLGLAPRAGRLR
jgi:hypothetical protein